ncbi:MAG TPA: DUF493 domain-containing protein [Thiotrichales bacterium]|nr:DUF493 domain-containing protein [Thiotrichales bacterium]
MNERETPIEFPCAFPIKAMGLAEHDIPSLALEIVRRHAPEVTEADLTRRLSEKGKYCSVTIVIQAQGLIQLDRIYQDLTDEPQILVAL